MESMWFVWLALSLVLWFTAIVPNWIWMLTSWEFRTPDKVLPSARRWRVFGANVAIIAVGTTALFVFTVWPGTALDKASAGFLTVVIGDIAVVAGLFIAQARRDRSAAAALEEGRVPATEPSEAAYAYFYLYVGVTAAAIFALAIYLYSDISRQSQPDTGLTPEEQAQVDEIDGVVGPMFEGMNDEIFDYYIEAPLPTVDAIPEGAIVASPLYYEELDAEERTPKPIWEYSEPAVPGIGETDELLAGADIVVGITTWRCVATQLVVVETADTVTVGLVVTLPAEPSAAGPSPSPNAAQSEIPACEMVGGSERTWYPVDLQGPLGTRQIVSVGGLALH